MRRAALARFRARERRPLRGPLRAAATTAGWRSTVRQGSPRCGAGRAGKRSEPPNRRARAQDASRAKPSLVAVVVVRPLEHDAEKLRERDHHGTCQKTEPRIEREHTLDPETRVQVHDELGHDEKPEHRNECAPQLPDIGRIVEPMTLHSHAPKASACARASGTPGMKKIMSVAAAVITSASTIGKGASP